MTEVDASDGDGATAVAGVDNGHSCGGCRRRDGCGRGGREPRPRMQAMATGMAGVDESHNCADVGGDDGCDCGGREPRLRMQATARRRGPQGDESDGGRRQPQGDEDDDATMPVEPDEGSWST
ncbi:hypothetical protein OsI_26715 [Oryza sativa Indica Group]|uniref:Uncharacterized protein n=1 Tax=Oryza sativa subsp. indica TaxID=39946 RepID=A2YNA1_ORYSI|nr:hypothetical protein OsI_26715 [Oryza sativa Indica Group]